MTEREIRQTVAAMRMDQEYKDVLLRRALNGEPEALFLIVAKRKQQKAAETSS